MCLLAMAQKKMGSDEKMKIDRRVTFWKVKVHLCIILNSLTVTSFIASEGYTFACFQLKTSNIMFELGKWQVAYLCFWFFVLIPVWTLKTKADPWLLIPPTITISEFLEGKKQHFTHGIHLKSKTQAWWHLLLFMGHLSTTNLCNTLLLKPVLYFKYVVWWNMPFTVRLDLTLKHLYSWLNNMKVDMMITDNVSILKARQYQS